MIQIDFLDNSSSISYVISAFSFMCIKYLFLNLIVQKGIEKGRQAITMLRYFTNAKTNRKTKNQIVFKRGPVHDNIIDTIVQGNHMCLCVVKNTSLVPVIFFLFRATTN